MSRGHAFARPVRSLLTEATRGNPDARLLEAWDDASDADVVFARDQAARVLALRAFLRSFAFDAPQ